MYIRTGLPGSGSTFTRVYVCRCVVKHHLLCSLMFFYIQTDLICLYTDRFDKCIYKQVYQGVRLSICGKPSSIMFMEVLVHTNRFDMSVYRQTGLISIYTDRFTRVCYNVYQGIHLSICDKPPFIMFIDVLVHIDRFDMSVHRQTGLICVCTDMFYHNLL